MVGGSIPTSTCPHAEARVAPAGETQARAFLIASPELNRWDGCIRKGVKKISYGISEYVNPSDDPLWRPIMGAAKGKREKEVYHIRVHIFEG